MKDQGKTQIGLNSQYWWSSGCGQLEFKLPLEAIKDCSHQGRCDEEVEYWEGQIEIPSTREHWIETLKGYGAWMMKDLREMDDEDLRQKLIWIAACDLREELEL